jgi:serine/threonine protein kinase
MADASKPGGTPLPLPEQFGRYRIIKRLGQGGMGSVYLAEDSQLGRRVAIKVPDLGSKDSTEVRERFLREARTAATLDHPALCPVYDVGEIDGRLYLTMAYLEGKSLVEAIPEKMYRWKSIAVGCDDGRRAWRSRRRVDVSANRSAGTESGAQIRR